MNKYLLYYQQSVIEDLIENNEFELLQAMDKWCEYNNPLLENAIKVILDNSDDLTDEFFDRFIEILDKYGKTEYALWCVRKRIETLKKERFEL